MKTDDLALQLGAEVLTPFGREQLFDMGIGTRLKYGELLKGFTGLPVFRTTSEDRMVKSAYVVTPSSFLHIHAHASTA